jgi:hypothetical protein
MSPEPQPPAPTHDEQCESELTSHGYTPCRCGERKEPPAPVASSPEDQKAKTDTRGGTQALSEHGDLPHRNDGDSSGLIEELRALADRLDRSHTHGIATLAEASSHAMRMAADALEAPASGDRKLELCEPCRPATWCKYQRVCLTDNLAPPAAQPAPGVSGEALRALVQDKSPLVVRAHTNFQSDLTLAEEAKMRGDVAELHTMCVRLVEERKQLAVAFNEVVMGWTMDKAEEK